MHIDIYIRNGKKVLTAMAAAAFKRREKIDKITKRNQWQWRKTKYGWLASILIYRSFRLAHK